ncbi:MAG: prolipoprotein diacylglyceryl transferase [Bacteroidetes bacterium]|nr:prolipoprotein diacylglyceryl transferase [Bacteroidota bacterium]
MWPVVAVSPFVFSTHTLFVGIGVAAALAVFAVEARRTGRSDAPTWFVAMGALAGGAFLSKAVTLWQIPAATPGWLATFAEGGRSVLGGLAGAYFGGRVARRVSGLSRPTGDLFAPAVALGLAVGRVGCHLTEPPGIPTGAGWGVRLSEAAAARLCPALHAPGCGANVPLHPSFLYESAFHALAFAVLWRDRRTPRPDALRFDAYLLAYALFRFGVEFVRGNAPFVGSLSRSQVFVLAAVPLLAVAVVRRIRSNPSIIPAEYVR